jgi:hypothetical protein
VPLSDEDVLCIVRTLEYDGVAEAIETEDGEVFRLARARIPEATPFTRFPCGVCPVRPAGNWYLHPARHWLAACLKQVTRFG